MSFRNSVFDEFAAHVIVQLEDFLSFILIYSNCCDYLKKCLLK